MSLKLFLILIFIQNVFSFPSQYNQNNQENIINPNLHQNVNKTAARIQQKLFPQFNQPIHAQSQLTPFLPYNPFPIQQQTQTSSGEIITENLIGGLPFNCLNKPTGHFRDSFFCDVFHACVYGQQRKTYSCPFVGELVYFDDRTRKCEFIRNNPYGCIQNNFLNFF
ncbi:unnamed protein product [Brachionus calyciflorus]|uniref:Chitin-binding type-2 domain-containing protein n=1 Tax=Brachionus calyciflorus TaxID=104777 RepID=A0A814IKX6_9BILA|nr:unnamed protein product [Brachionus calyciflorus]